jgi:hypothetical protein
MNDHRPRVAACVSAVFFAFASLTPDAALAADARGEALHSRIDRLFESTCVGPPVARANDAEFLRRVSLDLSGMTPSVEELRAFLADKAADKRANAVDRLLASPLFARHWATTLDVMLMERRPCKNVTADEWQNYLMAAARENRPLNQVISELLRADGSDPKARGPARFYLDRELEPNLIARDVGRIFFGRDLQCAHCHNHPLIEDYRQSDYYGLLAFFAPGYDPTTKEGMKKIAYPEKAGTDLAFDSVFVKGDHHLTGPRLPGGPELVEPVFPPGDEYRVKPADHVLAVPRHSRRIMLASLATGGANRAFNENVANRLWAVMMGRGLVHPVDLHHPGNPPTHPELLRLLGEEIAALQFDVKAFLREVALTGAYQRAIDLPGEIAPLPTRFAVELAELKARSGPMEAAVERARENHAKAIKAWHRAEDALIPLAAEQEKVLLKHAGVAKKEEEARNTLAAAEAAVAARRDTAKALAETAARAQDVVKKLPKEKELADAARVFAARSAAVVAEVTVLEKTAGERAAAVKKVADERAELAGAVESARAKVQPVRESVRREESVALEARRKLAEIQVALVDHQRRVAALEAYARWQGIREQIAANRRDVEASRMAIVEAKKRSGEQATVAQTRQDEARAAELKRVAADRSRAEAEAAMERHREAAARVNTALAATRAAQELLPADAMVSEAARKLKTKSDELTSVAAGLKDRADTARTALRKAGDSAGTAREALKTASAEMARREAVAVAAQAALGAAERRGDALRTELAAATDEITGLLGDRFAMAQLKPLTPEQMCWSILKVTGVYDRYRRIEEAELAKAKPLVGAAADDPAVRRARAIEVEQRTFDKLKGNLPAFIAVYGAGAGQPQGDFFATADQALFAANGGSINSWTAPAGGNVSERMIGENDARKAAEDLYLTVLSRPPSDEESAEVARLLAVPVGEKRAVVQELVWGLLTSAEFRFNH